jgi:DNA-binding transcriptional LysR family regulator
MELNQIRYFVQLARVLNFTRAAEICGVTQPALTRGIQQLEKELGGPLFHRERNHTQLTELGQILLPSLERALMASQEARIQAEAFRKRETSPLRVGLEYSIPTSIITPVIATLRRHADEIELTLRQESSADLCDRMLNGELDFALLVEGPQLSERLHRWRLFDEDYVVVCPSDHRFKEREMVDLAELTQECLLLHQGPACPTRRFMTELCAQERVRPRRQHFGNGLEQIFEMVQASLGISVAGARTPLTPMFFGRRFAAPGCNRTVVLSCVAGRRMGPTPSLFMKLMRARSWSAAVGANHGG